MSSKRKQSLSPLEDLEVESVFPLKTEEEEAADGLGEMRTAKRTSSVSEAEFDYESVSSPGGSSTASGEMAIWVMHILCTILWS